MAREVAEELRRIAVDRGVAAAEQVQVGPVEDQDGAVHPPSYIPPPLTSPARRRAVRASSAVASSARLTLHVETRYGTNAHHLIEAAFKAFARALREAVSIDPDASGVPSTKGTLT